MSANGIQARLELITARYYVQSLVNPCGYSHKSYTYRSHIRRWSCACIFIRILCTGRHWKSNAL